MTLRTWHKSIGSLTRPVTRLLKTGLYTPTKGSRPGDPSGEAALAPLKGELAARTG